MLNSFVNEMLPKDAESVFGQGLAGDMWKSMLADQVSRQIAKSGALGIAKRLFAAHPLSAAACAGAGEPRSTSRDAARHGANERQRPVAAERRRRRPTAPSSFADRQALMSAAILRHPNFAAANSGRSQSPAAMILPVVDRLRQALDEENQDIARRGPVDYRAYNLRKSQGLLELNRLAPALAGNAGRSRSSRGARRPSGQAGDQPPHAAARSCTAAQAVSDIIAQAIRESQSDGTYSARSWLDDDE